METGAVAGEVSQTSTESEHSGIAEVVAGEVEGLQREQGQGSRWDERGEVGGEGA